MWRRVCHPLLWLCPGMGSEARSLWPLPFLGIAQLNAVSERDEYTYIQLNLFQIQINIPLDLFLELPWWLRWQRICLQCWRPGFEPWVRKILWRKAWQPSLAFLPGESHGQRSLLGYSHRRVRHSIVTNTLIYLWKIHDFQHTAIENSCNVL